MRLQTIQACIILILITISSSYDMALADRTELKYPNAVNKLFIDSDKIETYTILANKVGLKIGHQYRYAKFAEIKRANRIGIAGEYESLLLSTGGNSMDFNYLSLFNKQKCGWEMTYYSNHDLTILWETCSDDSRTHSFVRVLKISKGKNTNLHLE